MVGLLTPYLMCLHMIHHPTNKLNMEHELGKDQCMSSPSFPPSPFRKKTQLTHHTSHHTPQSAAPLGPSTLREKKLVIVFLYRVLACLFACIMLSAQCGCAFIFANSASCMASPMHSQYHTQPAPCMQGSSHSGRHLESANLSSYRNMVPEQKLSPAPPTWCANVRHIQIVSPMHTPLAPPTWCANGTPSRHEGLVLNAAHCAEQGQHNTHPAAAGVMSVTPNSPHFLRQAENGVSF